MLYHAHDVVARHAVASAEPAAYNQWRPVTAIRAADVDGNPRTIADPTWTPLLVTPLFPDYIAGHTTYAGAAEEVLEHVFGRHPRIVMTLTSATAPGVTESYTSFEDIADGVVDARVWGGIHWRTSCCGVYLASCVTSGRTLSSCSRRADVLLTFYCDFKRSVTVSLPLENSV